MSTLDTPLRRFIAVVVLPLLFDRVTAQRDQSRCFDESTLFPTCPPIPDPNSNTTLPPLADTCPDLHRAQDVCHLLAKDYFHFDKKTWLNTTRHPELFVNLKAEDPLCDAIKSCYHKCLWCGDHSVLKNVKRQPNYNPGICYPAFMYFPNFYRCDAPRPAQQELIDNTTTPDYIQQTCSKLEALYQVNEYPATIELCRNQFRFYYKCQNLCPPPNQGCLDDTAVEVWDDAASTTVLELPQPSCEIPAATTTPANLNITATCDWIKTFYFGTNFDQRYWMHAKLLNAIPKDSQFCQDIKAAYPHCPWCSSISCYKYQPPSCSHEEELDATTDLLALPASSSDEWNVTQHQQSLCEDTIQSMKSSIERQALENPMDYLNDGSKYRYNQITGTFQECTDYQNAFPQCVFCTLDYCYDESDPPSCDDPNTVTISTTNSTPDTTPFVTNLTNFATTALALPSDVDLDILCDELFEQLYFPKGTELGFWENTTTTDLIHYRLISKSSQTCSNMNQYMHLCPWCLFASGSGEFCFNETNPPSCEYTNSTPYGDDADDDDLDIEMVCQDIYQMLGGYSTKFGKEHNPDIFWNASRHVPYLRRIAANTTRCEQARRAYQHCFWCVEQQQREQNMHEFVDLYSLCHGGYCPDPKELVGVAPGDPNIQATCVELEAVKQYQESNSKTAFPASTDLCLRARLTGWECDNLFCDKGFIYTKETDVNYLGATNDQEKAALVWTSRASALLSFFGSSFILCTILRDQKKRKTMFHQLLIAMAIFDVITALAWFMATLPIDRYDPGYIYGAVGNSATCTMQGFFIQLGFTSIFYNVSLALYYTLVISKGWREFQLQKIQMYMHGLPLLVGVGLALGGLPVYDWIDYACHIQPFDPNNGKTQLWPVLVFVVVPLGLSIMSITTSMGLVYYGVFRQAQAAKKWSANSNSSRMKKEVFWQCLWYVLAFYVTWPIMFAVYLASIDIGGPYGLSVMVAFVAPLQGFSNFLVFVRPKIQKFKKEREKRRARSKKQQELGISTATPTSSIGNKHSSNGCCPFILGSSILSPSILVSTWTHATSMFHTKSTEGSSSLEDTQRQAKQTDEEKQEVYVDRNGVSSVPDNVMATSDIHNTDKPRACDALDELDETDPAAMLEAAEKLEMLRLKDGKVEKNLESPLEEDPAEVVENEETPAAPDSDNTCSLLESPLGSRTEKKDSCQSEEPTEDQSNGQQRSE
eukprot:CAMPEP_0197439474 /NCGR_PEP_ID=MMETSP1175-20131217/6205_1 /TAXON_ID=1003142 /ORGANISM="Triceratium dubium, Strain CCMP147" /LENGTH=1214 /DNA_ID=CAMNT_0042969395 /DNA_START=77 /DNA_END=3721 /DNA_ORIENTATION=-